MSKRDLTSEERRMWAAASRHVRRLDQAETPEAVITDELRKPKASLSPPFGETTRSKPPASVKALRKGKNVLETGPVQNRQNERRVRRGKQVISASFDLHGFNQEEAWNALPKFLSRERARGSRCVIIITGKGRYGDGVLRRNFLRWIETRGARALISGYAPAHQRHGGGGAWYVYLRKLSPE